MNDPVEASFPRCYCSMNDPVGDLHMIETGMPTKGDIWRDCIRVKLPP